MRNERAFTLIELVVVLTFMAAIMGMVAISIRASLSSTESEGAAADVLTLLRHARDVALYQKKTVHVVFEELSDQCYMADYDSRRDIETPIRNADDGPTKYQLPKGMSFSSVEMPADARALGSANAPKNAVRTKYVRFTRFGTASAAVITLQPETGRKIVIVGDPATGYFTVPKPEENK